MTKQRSQIPEDFLSDLAKMEEISRRIEHDFPQSATELRDIVRNLRIELSGLFEPSATDRIKAGLARSLGASTLDGSES